MVEHAHSLLPDRNKDSTAMDVEQNCKRRFIEKSANGERLREPTRDAIEARKAYAKRREETILEVPSKT